MAQLRDCMNLKMAKPAAEFSLKDPARIEVICKTKVYDGINEDVLVMRQTCVLKHASENPRRKPVKTARYWLDTM